MKRRSVVIGTGVALVVLLTPFSMTATATEEVPFKTTYKTSDQIELGERRTDKNGTAGRAEVTYRTKGSLLSRMFGASKNKEEISFITIQKAEDAVIVTGTRRWQYMICSNGTYRYYTDEQMKDQNTGFTSKSPDSCVQNNGGTKVSLADSPPTATYNNYSGSSAVYLPTLPTYSYGSN